MSDTVSAALIGVGGAVIVAISGAVAQWKLTRNVVQAERDKVTIQIQGEASVRSKERRESLLLEAVSTLLAASDPQVSPGGDYSAAVRQIHRIQLILRRGPGPEERLYRRLNSLGHALEEYIVARSAGAPFDTPELKRLLEVQGQVSDIASEVLGTKTSSPPLQRSKSLVTPDASGAD